MHLKKSDFAAWLKKFDSDYVVSRDWGCASCPLAKWLQSVVFTDVYVSPSETKRFSEIWWFVGNQRVVINIPPWGVKFAMRADHGLRSLTAKQCLELLGAP
jgi:hypothetical protein